MPVIPAMLFGSWLHEPYLLHHSGKLSHTSSSVPNSINRSKSKFLHLHFLTFRKSNTCPNLFGNNVVRTNIRWVQKTQIKSSDKNGWEECGYAPRAQWNVTLFYGMGSFNNPAKSTHHCLRKRTWAWGHTHVSFQIIGELVPKYEKVNKKPGAQTRILPIL